MKAALEGIEACADVLLLCVSFCHHNVSSSASGTVFMSTGHIVVLDEPKYPVDSRNVWLETTIVQIVILVCCVAVAYLSRCSILLSCCHVTEIRRLLGAVICSRWIASLEFFIGFMLARKATQSIKNGIRWSDTSGDMDCLYWYGL